MYDLVFGLQPWSRFPIDKLVTPRTFAFRSDTSNLNSSLDRDSYICRLILGASITTCYILAASKLS